MGAAVRRGDAPRRARKFEPPAVTGGESQEAIAILLSSTERPATHATSSRSPGLDYLGRSRLPDGRLARFYELRRTGRSISPRITCSLIATPTCPPTMASRPRIGPRSSLAYRNSAPGGRTAAGTEATARKTSRPSQSLEDRVKAAIADLMTRGGSALGCPARETPRGPPARCSAPVGFRPERRCADPLPGGHASLKGNGDKSPDPLAPSMVYV